MKTDYLFRLQYHVGGGVCTITAWEGGFQEPNHTRIDVEMRWTSRRKGKTIVVFPRGATYCATPGCIDDNSAKELVTATIAMKPGDTNDEFFESYTPEQLAWVTRYGEELSCESQARYCDEDGNVR